jgi:phosphatidylethanolamine-binding protein (PEBP) family uncharacterized protein
MLNNSCTDFEARRAIQQRSKSTISFAITVYDDSVPPLRARFVSLIIAGVFILRVNPREAGTGRKAQSALM